MSQQTGNEPLPSQRGGHGNGHAHETHGSLSGRQLVSRGIESTGRRIGKRRQHRVRRRAQSYHRFRGHQMGARKAAASSGAIGPRARRRTKPKHMKLRVTDPWRCCFSRCGSSYKASQVCDSSRLGFGHFSRVGLSLSPSFTLQCAGNQTTVGGVRCSYVGRARWSQLLVCTLRGLALLPLARSPTFGTNPLHADCRRSHHGSACRIGHVHLRLIKYLSATGASPTLGSVHNLVLLCCSTTKHRQSTTSPSRT